MNTGRYFPALRIVEDKMSIHEIQEAFKTAFGGGGVETVTKGKKYHTIHIDQSNMQRMYAWDEFYEALDEYGAVWIEAKYRGDDYWIADSFTFVTEPTEGYWEVHYAKKTPPRRSTAPEVDPRVSSTGKLLHSPCRPWPPIPRQKKCSCGCTCGARIGTTF